MALATTDPLCRVLRMTEIYAGGGGGLRESVRTARLVAGRTGRNIAPPRPRLRAVALKAIRMGIQTRRDRHRLPSGGRPMTLSAVCEPGMLRMIEHRSEAPEPGKRLDRGRRMTNNADRVLIIREFLLMA